MGKKSINPPDAGGFIDPLVVMADKDDTVVVADVDNVGAVDVEPKPAPDG